MLQLEPVSSVREVLKNPNYRLYFLGQFISLSGTWAQSVAVSWLVFRLTGSSYSVGLIAFATQIPAFLLSPFAGVLADRLERRRIFVFVQWAGMIQAILLAALVFAGIDKLWVILLLSVALGCVNSFEITTRQSLAVDIVDREHLQGAIALNSALMNVTRVLGPAMAGVMIQAVGEKWCFVFNAISYVAIMFSLYRMEFRPQTTFAKSQAFWNSIGDAFRYLADRPRMNRILVTACAQSAISACYAVLLPVFSRRVLSGSADVFAWLTSVGAMGAVLGALSIGRRAAVSTIRKDVLTGFIWIGLTLVAFATSKWLPLSLACALIFGFHTIRAWPLMNHAIQQDVDDVMRGRVMGLFNMTFLGTTPLTSLCVGWISDRFGARPTLLSVGISVAFTGVTLLWFGRTRQPQAEFSRAAGQST